MDIFEKLKHLSEMLDPDRYNAKPSKLRQGSIFAVFFNEDGTTREGTEEEYDELYEKVRYGHGT